MGPINAAAVARLGDQPVDWRCKGLPPSWSGRTPADICAEAPNLFESGATSPVCVLRADALAHNIATMAEWCRHAAVELAPHGKTHMAPQLLARQLEAGACAITAATIGQVRVYRAFGVRDVILANELVDAAGLRWLATELASDPEFGFVCWVDSVRGVEIMAAELTGTARPVNVCVEVGLAGGRTGCRSATAVEEVALAAVACPQLRLVGVAGYEAALGHAVTPDALDVVADYLRRIRSSVLALRRLFETAEAVVTAGGSTYFDTVAEELTGWPDGMAVRTVLRSGCYLTHDDGLYARTSPLTRRAGDAALQPALSVWAQVVSRPEKDLAVLTMGRRDASFDQDLPVPYGLSACYVTRFDDQHAYLQLSPQARLEVGEWVQFGISHPCTTFDKWVLIPVVDADDRVVDLIRTFF